MNKDERIVKWESQVRKGMLDFIILMCLAGKEFYGYELIKRIKEVAGLNVSEGTVYPLLNRLKKEELITSKWVEMDTGIPRKYYSITEKGTSVLGGMKEAWFQFSRSINQFMEEK